MVIRNLMGCSFLIVARLCLTQTGYAQSPPNPNYVRQEIYPTYQAFKDDLLTIVGIADPAQRTSQLNSFWNALQAAGQVPYAQDNQVAFLYRGSAGTVAWPGDFNGWNPGSSSWQGTQFAGTDLWIVEKTFPVDARLDYKVVLNGSTWILDPANPLQMWGGFGPNNELRMPDYVFPQETVRQTGVPRGILTGNNTTFSSSLGYNVNYRIYTPAGYDLQSLTNLPVVYVTDGHEYLADHLGSMVVVLDNLINSRDLRPTMAVFIDPRDPSNQANNRRATEYTGNPNFANFVADELAALVDSAYRTDASPSGRTILGTSLGGVNSAYFGGTRSDVFENIAVQSPSNFTSIFNLYATQALQDEVDLFMTAGTIGDGSGGPSFANTLNNQGYNYSFLQTNEGHSWGNWRALLDSILIGLIGPSPYSADFDNDIDVDSADLATWLSAFGLSDLADADGDGDSDGSDFLEWQRQFGSGVGVVSSSTAVPEPTSACSLFVLGLMLVQLWSRNRR